MKQKGMALINTLVSIMVIFSFLTTTVSVHAEGDTPPASTPAPEVSQPSAEQPDAAVPPAPAATQPDAEVPPAPAATQPDAEVPPSPAATQPDAAVPSSPAATQPDAEVPPAPAATQPDSADTPAPAVTQSPTGAQVPAATSETLQSTLLPASVDTQPAKDDKKQSTQQPTEVATILATIATLPAKTDLVVQDTNGNTLPLATKAAAAVIAAGDPVWCPTGSLPGGAGCTTSFTHFNGSGGLIESLAAQTGAGTIYVASDYDATVAGDHDHDITFNQTYLPNLTDLVFQGGWDFLSNALSAVQGYSVFDLGNGGLHFLNWGSTLTLNDITIQNSTSGLDANSASDVTLNNVNVSNSGSESYNPGAYIGSSGNVRVNNSTFNNNKYQGLFVSTGSSGNIDLNNVAANHNGDNGLEFYSNKDITLNNVSANTNLRGANLNSAKGSVNLNGTNIFSDNIGSGLWVVANKDISLNNVTANNNNKNGTEGRVGAYLQSDNGGLITLAGTNQFNGNGFNGLSAFTNGSMILNNITANDNIGNGVGLYHIDTINNSTVTMTGTNEFIGNSVNGLNIDGSGNITLNNITAKNNGWHNLWVYSSNGDITIYNTTADNAGSDGFYLESIGNITLFCSKATNNQRYGIEADLPGSLNLNGVTFNGNLGGDAILGNDGSPLINYHPEYECAPVDPTPTESPTSTATSSPTPTATDPAAPTPTASVTPTPTPPVSPIETPTVSPSKSGSSNNDQGGQSIGGLIIPLTGGLPWNIISVTDIRQSDLTCQSFAGTKLVMQNGDSVILPCPIKDKGTLDSIKRDSLPGSLPGTATFLSGLTFTVIKDGKTSPNLDNNATVSFKIPEGADKSKLNIHYWDGSKWIALAGASVTSDGYLEATTTQPGTFVLVQE